MKKLILVCSLALLVFMGNRVFLEGGFPYQSKIATYANSQVDTVRFTRYSTLQALTFYASWSDSVTCTSAILRRIVNNQWLAVQAGDTLTGLSNQSTTAVLKFNAITLAPLPDEYAVIITYADSSNGVTTPSVTYRAEQTLYSK